MCIILTNTDTIGYFMIFCNTDLELNREKLRETDSGTFIILASISEMDSIHISIFKFYHI
jgi:hypothetical protein